MSFTRPRSTTSVGHRRGEAEVLFEEQDSAALSRPVRMVLAICRTITWAHPGARTWRPQDVPIASFCWPPCDFRRGDRTIKLWDTIMGSLICSLETQYVLSVAFSAGGARVLWRQPIVRFCRQAAPNSIQTPLTSSSGGATNDGLWRELHQHYTQRLAQPHSRCARDAPCAAARPHYTSFQAPANERGNPEHGGNTCLALIAASF